jgi:hypothetical protein
VETPLGTKLTNALANIRYGQDPSLSSGLTWNRLQKWSADGLRYNSKAEHL